MRENLPHKQVFLSLTKVETHWTKELVTKDGDAGSCEWGTCATLDQSLQSGEETKETNQRRKTKQPARFKDF